MRAVAENDMAANCVLDMLLLTGKNEKWGKDSVCLLFAHSISVSVCICVRMLSCTQWQPAAVMNGAWG